MDKDRQIRFLYPPLIFLTSIALGAWFDKTPIRSDSLLCLLENHSNANVFIVLLGTSSIILVIGFIIGTVNILLLRFGFWLFAFDWNYEFFYQDDKTYQEFGKLILKDPEDKIKPEDRLNAIVVFDHSVISDKVHSWIVRRWNSFIISSSSAVALLASLLIGHYAGVMYTYHWCTIVILTATIFIVLACVSWLESVRMLKFLTRVKKEDPNPPNNSNPSNDS